MIGKTLGQYKLLDEIGRGGMGVVYLAEHVELGTRYAVKVLPEELSRSTGFIERFKTEARVMARLSHPAIVKVLNLGSSGDRYYLAMELVLSRDGKPKDLQTLVEERGGRLPSDEVLDAVVQIAEALEYAHTYRDDLVKDGVVHRDLKPANVLLGADGRFRVSDFGLAKIIGDEFILSKVRESFSTSVGGRPTRVLKPKGEGDEASSTDSARADDWDGTERTLEHKRKRMRTSSESILGTYDYMSPEQRDPARAGAVDRRSDIYALGVIAYRLLTGRKPEGRFKLPSQIDPQLPAFWDMVIEDTLQPDPDDRHSSCGELIALLADERPEARRRLDEQRQLDEERQRLKREQEEIAREKERLAAQTKRAAPPAPTAVPIAPVARPPQQKGCWPRNRRGCFGWGCLTAMILFVFFAAGGANLIRRIEQYWIRPIIERIENGSRQRKEMDKPKDKGPDWGERW